MNNGTSWNHRAYWGSNSINWGEDNTPSRLRKGDLPKAGDELARDGCGSGIESRCGFQVTVGRLRSSMELCTGIGLEFERDRLSSPPAISLPRGRRCRNNRLRLICPLHFATF